MVAKKKRILYVVTNGHIGGPQTHLIHCCKGLGHEFDIAVCTGTKGYFCEEIQKLSLPLYILPVLGGNRPSLQDPWAVRDLIKIIKKFQPDLISCHSTKGGFLGRIAGRMTEVPTVFTAHGWAFRGPWMRRAVAPPIERRLSRWSSQIICVSEYDRNLALEHEIGAPEKLVTIHNGIPILRNSMHASHGAKEKVILTMVARFAVPKDHILLLQALSRLKTQTNYEVWFVGSGKLLASVKEEVGKLNLLDRVRFLGERKDDIPSILAQSDIFVLLSNWEGFPRSILEAMRAGLPVLASDVGGVKEAVQDEGTGFLVPPGDAEAVKQKLQILLESPSLRGAMGHSGYKRFLENFTLDKMLSRTRKVYSNVTGIYYPLSAKATPA